MKVYGYSKKKLSAAGLLEMREVTLCTSPETVRQIASFLLAAADAMEKKGEAFSHMHVDEVVKKWPRSWPQIIVGK